MLKNTMQKTKNYSTKNVRVAKKSKSRVAITPVGLLGKTVLKVPGAIVLALVILVVVGSSIVPRVFADQFDEQIRALQQQNAAKQNNLAALKVEASSYEDAIAKLQAQISNLQAQIDANRAMQTQLQTKIIETQAELDRQRKVLGENIKVMYVEGQISNLEILATSKNLSDFVDKAEYRNAVKSKIQDTLKKIAELQKTLNTQKVQVDALLAEQQTQQNQLSYSRTEQSRLLNYNTSQQNAYNAEIQGNNKKISELKRQQVIANMDLFGGNSQPGIPGGGGYPWGNAYCVHTQRVGGDCYNYDWYFNGGPWDPWGYGYRNCTSWVAYKLATDGKSGISNLGNANDWPSRAAARGLGVSNGSGARAGDAAVNPRGYYGHVMYVEAVLPDGRVVVSDYNRAGDGLYRGPDGGNANVLPQSGLIFIHF
jgi:surface antigen/peptidoglycan hydrolase CwlO-like protein